MTESAPKLEKFPLREVTLIAISILAQFLEKNQTRQLQFLAHTLSSVLEILYAYKEDKTLPNN